MRLLGQVPCAALVGRRWQRAVTAIAAALLLTAGATAVPAPTPAPAHAARSSTSAAAPAAAPKGDPAARLRAAVDQLILEARDLDNFDTPQHPPRFSRPHPLLKDFGPEMAAPTLARMLQPFTDNEYRDTYIRWHLLWVVRKVSPDQRRATGPLLIDLVRAMPGPLKVAARVESRWEPLDIFLKYRDLSGSPPGPPQLIVQVGYPPFQHNIQYPDSLKYATEAQVTAYHDYQAKYPSLVAAYKARLAEAERLYGGKFKLIRDPGAVAFNARLREMEEVMRHYRGELIYAAIQSGDPPTGKLVVSEICRLAKARNGVAFDLLSYFYLAAFDGGLNRYSQNDLNEMGAELREGAIASEGYMNYGGQTRNFADAAFHMIMLLQDGGGFIVPAETKEPG